MNPFKKKETVEEVMAKMTKEDISHVIYMETSFYGLLRIEWYEPLEKLGIVSGGTCGSVKYKGNNPYQQQEFYSGFIFTKLGREIVDILLIIEDL